MSAVLPRKHNLLGNTNIGQPMLDFRVNLAKSKVPELHHLLRVHFHRQLRRRRLLLIQRLVLWDGI